MRPEQILLDVSADEVIVESERYIGEEREEVFARLALGYDVSAWRERYNCMSTYVCPCIRTSCPRSSLSHILQVYYLDITQAQTSVLALLFGALVTSVYTLSESIIRPARYIGSFYLLTIAQLTIHVKEHILDLSFSHGR